MSKQPKDSFRTLLGKAEKALDTLYDLVYLMPESPQRSGQLRYLDSCYRSIRVQRRMIGGISKLRDQ